MRSSPRPDRGQSVVELALTLPVVMAVLLGVVQVVAVAVDQLSVTHLAREAARAASVAADADRAARDIVAQMRPGDDAVDVTTRLGGEPAMVTVTVTRLHRTDVPLAGALVPDLTVRGTVTMQREPP